MGGREGGRVKLSVKETDVSNFGDFIVKSKQSA